MSEELKEVIERILAAFDCMCARDEWDETTCDELCMICELRKQYEKSKKNG